MHLGNLAGADVIDERHFATQVIEVAIVATIEEHAQPLPFRCGGLCVPHADALPADKEKHGEQGDANTLHCLLIRP